jgi:hypothetical protein
MWDTSPEFGRLVVWTAVEYCGERSGVVGVRETEVSKFKDERGVRGWRSIAYGLLGVLVIVGEEGLMPVGTVKVVGVRPEKIIDIRPEKEYIFEFNITMNDVKGVDMVDSVHELREEVSDEWSGEEGGVSPEKIEESLV